MNILKTQYKNFMDMSHTTTDKISIVPGLGTVIGVATIVSNTFKALDHIGAIGISLTKVGYFKIRLYFSENNKTFSSKKNVADIYKSYYENKLINDIKFIGRGLIRAIPIVGPAVLVYKNIDVYNHG